MSGFAPVWHSSSSRQRNQLLKILGVQLRVVDSVGVRVCHWQDQSPCTLGWHYRADHDTWHQCLLVHHALAGRAPAYITDLLLLVAAVTSRQTVLQSATTNTLFTPRTRLRFGERAFCVVASKAWNQLPNSLHSLHDTNSFKKKLKTFVYKILLCVIFI